MRSRCFGWLAGAALLLLPSETVTAQETLRAVITGVRAEQGGEVIVALYDRPSRWLVLDSAVAVRRIVPQNDSLVVTFEGLVRDSSYALAVIHDRNGNGKMDMRWLPWPKPKEGAGVSNNHARAGKPRYDEATFPARGTSLVERIVLRY